MTQPRAVDLLIAHLSKAYPKKFIESQRLS